MRIYFICFCFSPLIENSFRCYCKSGQLDEAYLRFLWMHRKIEPQGRGVNLENVEVNSIVATMTRLLVMYRSRSAEERKYVVPARLPLYGCPREPTPDILTGITIRMQCSFGQVYPPPGIVGRLLAWSTDRVVTYGDCWQHGAFFSYKFQGKEFKVFLYESENNRRREDGRLIKTFAALTVGVQGSPEQAPGVLRELKALVGELVRDQAHGYPGLGHLIHFRETEEIDTSDVLAELRAVVERQTTASGRLHTVLGRQEAVAERQEAIVERQEAVVLQLEETVKELGDIVRALLEQDLLAATEAQSEFPRLMILKPEQANRTIESENLDQFRYNTWNRWITAWEKFGIRDPGFHQVFRLQFLCEYDLSEVPCGPDGNGYPIKKLANWVKRCIPLLQVRIDSGNIS